jgi:hypothetical protein
MKCSRCERADDARPVPRWVRLTAAMALGFAHAGMWANEELAKPLCAACRRRATALALTAAAIGLSAAAAGACLLYRFSRTSSRRCSEYAARAASTLMFLGVSISSLIR